MRTHRRLASTRRALTVRGNVAAAIAARMRRQVQRQVDVRIGATFVVRVARRLRRHHDATRVTLCVGRNRAR